VSENDPRVEWTDAERAALERLRAAAPPTDLEEAVIDTLTGAGLLEPGVGGIGASGGAPERPATPRVPARRAWSWVALAAAACVAAFLAGRMVADRGAGTPAGAPLRTYVVLLYADERFEVPATADEEAALVAEYSGWARDLRARGIPVRGEELEPDAEAEWLSRPGGEVVATAGAPAGAAGKLTGFYILELPSDEDAAALARTVPHLRHGGTVVVRAVVPH
jgi:hypothetical protein